MSRRIPSCAITAITLTLIAARVTSGGPSSGPGDSPGSGGGSTPSGPQTWNVPGDFSSIQAAVDAAADGDTIALLSGQYHENVTVAGKLVYIEAAGGAFNPAPHWWPAGSPGSSGPMLNLSDGAAVLVREIAFHSITTFEPSGEDVLEVIPEDGCAINVVESTIVAEDCDFDGLGSNSSVAGGISAALSWVIVRDSSFNDCRGQYAGAIATENSYVAIETTDFEDCIGGLYAGAIRSNGIMYLKQCIFESCESTSGSGAVAAFNGTTLNMERCVISNCDGKYAAVYGSIPATPDPHNIKFCKFSGCSAWGSLARSDSLDLEGFGSAQALYACDTLSPPYFDVGITTDDVIATSMMCSGCPGDTTLDGDRSVHDLIDLLSRWGERDPLCDLNGDGVVSGTDVTIFMESGFGGWCPPPV
ncbi:MAG TPA: right-handed parallel beta-helix repeat-containing protein [Phycisphaerales bacterium]|nr:right-handed parallel beta-helix repeat-containing protein [Phycisphaerales bacterium]